MKIKLLLAPALVVGIIVLLIWAVYPAYTNPVNNDGLLEKYSQLKTEREKLSTIDMKMANARNLISQINSKKEDADALMEFIPSESKEENVIDSLNFFSRNSNLEVKEISVLKGENVTKPSSSPVQMESDGSANAIQKIAKIEPEEINVNISVEGEYQNIKIFLEKVLSMSRFNQVKNLVLSRPSASSGEENPNPNLLEMNAVLIVKKLKLAVNPVNADDPIFLSSSLDMRGLEDIRLTRSEEQLNLEVGQTGSTNPFSPISFPVKE